MTSTTETYNDTLEYNQSAYPIPLFTSMGMLIIDEIHFPDNRSLYDILGGGGTFAILGARLVLGPTRSRQSGWLVDIGSDCPASVLQEFQSWNSGAVIRHDPTRLTTRGWNNYGKNDFRQFKYLTPKKRIDVEDLLRYGHLLHSASYHLICSPERCTEVLSKLKPLRDAEGDDEPVIIWEPIPDDCVPEHLDRCVGLLDKVDVLSPNAAECAAFFGEAEPMDQSNCERIAGMFLRYMTKNDHSGIVLRCGALGCLLLTQKEKKWFDAYHSDPNSGDYKVVDPTGCGNGFVGAFAVAFVLSGYDFNVGCVCGTLASGLCIEQHGMPKLTAVEQGDELWNGISFKQALTRYLTRNESTGLNTEQVLRALKYI